MKAISSTTDTSIRSSSNPRKSMKHNPNFLNGADHKVQSALASIFLLYIFLTLGTFIQLSDLTTNDIISEPLQSIPPPQQQQRRRRPEQQLPSQQSTSNEISMEKIKKLQMKFPIHVHDKSNINNNNNYGEEEGTNPEVEKIIHPAYSQGGADAIFDTVSKYLIVPKFYNPIEYGGDIRKYLGDYGKRLLTREEASSIGSFYSDSATAEPLETIFVAISSYRDPECVPTLDSLFDRAKYPQRLRVTVIDQRLPDSNDPDCLQPTISCDVDPNQTLCKYGHLIEGMYMDSRLGVGPVFARHLGYRYYRGEYFAMQVDSHVRFVEHWDDSLVLQWKQANNEMAVLTTYLSDLNDSIDPVTNKAIRPGRPIMCKTDYEGHGAYKHLRHGQQPEGPPYIHGTPTLHPFWAAGFSFARGHFVIQVPYDQFLPMIFQGEEISLGLRGFTFGYDYYTPEKSVCFHMYAMKENKGKRDKVPHFWENNSNFGRIGTKAMRRLNKLIGMENKEDADNDAFDHTDIEKYSLGQVRETDKFFQTYGIHPETQTVEDNLCMFVGQRMQRMFTPALREDGMGLDYKKINFVFKDPAPRREKK